jgi:SPP1 family predicted phage head-tail adaptor
MKAQNLRIRLEFQTSTETQNEFRETVRAWTTKSVVWATIEPVPAAASIAAAAARLDEPLRLRMRYRDDVLAKTTRFLRGPTVYEVQSAVDPDNRRRDLLVLALVHMHEGSAVVIP